eukprot:jgi/Ulvmu1/4416/UM002_0141.1
MGGYYDIDDILASETLFPTTLHCGSSRTAELLDIPSQRGADGGRDQLGANKDLPWWLASSLQKQNLATVKRPNFLGDRIQRRLTAGAACENLKARCPYYYSMAKEFCALDSTDPAISHSIFSSFRERFCKVAEGTLGMNRTDAITDLEQKLSLEEAFLHQGASTTAYHAKSWMYDHSVHNAIFQ